ncbi:molybdenum ABC transporter ATP-binding protein [Falsirhodobacter halotolerans]|uniref:molybdenum ABC transporter ATP-binding protein n=1 Tax=Falsirhodobacter halotolerans TaxID=1146892 RepID=UPI001FCF98A9|nr:molybdenum ABC transporter ATP-binding protein [Falsirhodobacter halotolerans]MCJ8139207.1 molybdenum ABC transporter ATP-binding protein [Falsirhodobacter halotolerans]
MTLSVHLRHAFPTIRLDVAFDAAGGVTALFGRSGAGKSTVANAIAGLLRPDAGHIRLAGRTLFDGHVWVPPHRRRVGYVFQNARLFPHMSVRRNLLYGAPSDRDLPAIAALLGIEGLLDRRPAGLSGGEQQRVAIGRALLMKPELLVLDEPLSALDTARKAEILPYLERLRDETALPMLYVSHSIAEVTRLAGQVILLDRGAVSRIGTPAEMFGNPDLAPHLDRRELGGVISGLVHGTEDDGLTRVETAGGPVWLATRAPPGATVRIRIASEDVLLSLHRPEGLSAQNILNGRIVGLTDQDGAVLVRLALSDGDHLVARITRRARRQMGLEIGQAVHAILKTVALGDQG